MEVPQSHLTTTQLMASMPSRAMQMTAVRKTSTLCRSSSLEMDAGRATRVWHLREEQHDCGTVAGEETVVTKR